MYMAWLCYAHEYDTEYDNEREIKIVLEEPDIWAYAKVIPVQFSVLHQWSYKDRELYIKGETE